MNRALLVVATAAAMAVGASTVASAATAKQGTRSVAGVQVGQRSSWPTGVDNRGEVVGAYNTASGTRGYVWRSGVFTDLGVLNGGGYTYATSVNDGDEVVGYSGNFAASSGVQAFEWANGGCRAASRRGARRCSGCSAAPRQSACRACGRRRRRAAPPAGRSGWHG
jgi:probable HAF family extracellular repeat protein